MFEIVNDIDNCPVIGIKNKSQGPVSGPLHTVTTPLRVNTSARHWQVSSLQANLLSSHRKFLTRLDVVEMTDSLSGRGDSLTLFLFSDSLEVNTIV